MRQAAHLKQIRRHRSILGTRPGKVVPWLLFGASVGLCLGIGAGTARAQTAATPNVGRLSVDLIIPFRDGSSDDQHIGTYAFPSASAALSIPFGAGLPNVAYGECKTNCLTLDIGPTAFAVLNNIAPIGTLPIAFLGGLQDTIKVTTVDSRLINLVQTQADTFGLKPGALLFGDNFFQVDLADAGPLYPQSGALFSVDYSGGLGASPAPAPVPAPASLPLMASGLAALALTRLATRTGVSTRGGRAERPC